MLPNKNLLITLVAAAVLTSIILSTGKALIPAPYGKFLAS